VPQNKAMASESFDFKQVTRVTAGAIGDPGGRVFYLQLRAAGELVSLALEKDQLRALTERLQEVFTRVQVAPPGRVPNMALEQPINPVWRVGFMTLTYSQEEKTFEVSLVEQVEEGAEPATGHFQASLAQMQALAAHAATVISAGRPPCPMCGGPIDHDGGVCPRLNGHH
jgi:uncharacterized repeat protein (TIGR03847 family)